MSYFLVRSCLDENEAFLTSADSAVKLLPEATKPMVGWKGIEYRTAFPVVKPQGASFYPPDMDKMVYTPVFIVYYMPMLSFNSCFLVHLR